MSYAFPDSDFQDKAEESLWTRVFAWNLQEGDCVKKEETFQQYICNSDDSLEYIFQVTLGGEVSDCQAICL